MVVGLGCGEIWPWLLGTVPKLDDIVWLVFGVSFLLSLFPVLPSEPLLELPLCESVLGVVL